FGTFDVNIAKDAVQYAESMAPVLKAAQSLVTAIEGSLLKRRYKAVEQSLALYAAMKAGSRVDASLRPSPEALGEHLPQRRPGRTRKSKKNAPHATPATPQVDKAAAAPAPAPGEKKGAEPATNAVTVNMGQPGA